MDRTSGWRDADGSSPVQVTKNGTVGSFQPTWSPDGMWLAFERNVGFSTPTWTTTAGTTETVIKDTANNFVTSGIDDTMTVVVTGKGSAKILSVDDLDTLTLATPIVGLVATDTYKIIRDKYELFVIKADGTGEKNLSATIPAGGTKVYSDYAPSWSPKGDKLAFTTQRNAHEDIYTVTIDPATATLTAASLTNLTPGDVTDFPEPAYEPDWSPDASKIVMHTQRGSRRRRRYRQHPVDDGDRRYPDAADQLGLQSTAMQCGHRTAPRSPSPVTATGCSG